MNHHWSALGLLALAAAAGAEPFGEPPIEVTAMRAPLPAEAFPGALHVLDARTLDEAGIDHPLDALRLVPGLQVVDLYGDGSRGSFLLRGLDATGNALVLVDGRPLNNPDLAPPDLNGLALQDIDRIEVIEGSAAVLWGDQAVGGVVNIVTRPADTAVGEAAYEIGDWGRRGLRGHWRGPVGAGWFVRVSGLHRRADNYRRHNRSELDAGSLRLDAHWDGGRFWLAHAVGDDRVQTPGALLPEELAADRRQSAADFANDYSAQRSESWHLAFDQAFGRWRLLVDAHHRRLDGEFVLSFRGAPADPAAPPSLQQRRVSGLQPRLLGAWPVAHGDLRLILGGDFERSDYRLASALGTQDNDQERRALYAQLIWPALPRAELSLGLRRAAVENDLRDRPLFGSGVPDDADLDDEATAAAVGLAVENGALRHLLRYTTHYRFPKVDEHTASAVVPDWLTGERGDPLRTQTGRSLELGVEYRVPAAFARFMLYRLELDDQIVYDPGRFMNINLEAARHDGALFALQRRLGEHWRLDLDAAWLDARQSAGPNAGRKVPLAAPRSARLALTWTPDGDTDVQLAGRWVDERPVGGDVDNSRPPLPAHTVFDLHLERRFGPVFAALTVRNLGDERYSEMAAETLLFDPITFAATETTGFYPAPARSLFLEIGTRWP